MPGTLLAMFAKFWQPGEVKTRLAAAIGPGAAVQLHRAFVETLLGRMHGVAQRCVLAYSPSERRSEFAALVRGATLGGRESISSPPRAVEAPSGSAATKPTPDPFAHASSWSLAPQSPGDLGARMAHFFQSSLAGGAERVVLIGSDSPTLPIEHVRQAFDELRRHEVVMGPSDDGGYYLIGLVRGVGSAVRTGVHDSTDCDARRPDASMLANGPQSGPYCLPPIFDGMPWSTPRVWHETVRRLDDSGWSYAVLPAWYDVDEPADLERLRGDLRGVEGDAVFSQLKIVVDGIVGQQNAVET